MYVRIIITNNVLIMIKQYVIYRDMKPEHIQAHFGVVNTKDLRLEKYHQQREVELVSHSTIFYTFNCRQ